MAKIGEEEYELLKGLDEEWKWIARDEGGELYIYEEKPKRFAVEWVSERDYYLYLGNETLQFIQWEDSEPWNVQELIVEYEINQKIQESIELGERAIRDHASKQLQEEREETEVKKDIKWLNNEVEKRIKKIRTDEVSFAGSDFFDEGYIHGMKDVKAIANQLDESEVLSEYWIEQKSIDTHVDTLSGEVQVTFRLDDLQNLRLPEWELPVIPQFVAEFLRGKEKYMLYELLDNDFIYDNHDELARWLYDNDEKTNKEREISLVLAHIYGYEVEEEPLYRARLKVITDEFIASYLRTQSSGAEDRLKALEIGSKYIHEDYRHLSEFTKGELKRLDIWGSGQWEIEEVEENRQN